MALMVINILQTHPKFKDHRDVPPPLWWMGGMLVFLHRFFKLFVITHVSGLVTMIHIIDDGHSCDECEGWLAIRFNDVFLL